ncbi:helix-turn-helix domain-containing protein [Bradyrhizobium septentrionale]|uniref:Helix-turn-helix domain-containing protein n=1 Tax=Bradyrhizobium septentrionale TaxID=1404411 RepID=A0A973VZ29_9BRAD|nr:helix-turn-helix domain-containing protein [Bradyrhizobium septentrionale]UGY13095.1 helix-turn-helix domain-containing protein [Bradyrhizobium septentrionale]UGY21715.1 helix-turn-helix domain-containing protein [Bradyrhizobium septentrionale]
MRRHSTDEITSKVKQAEELMARGQSQAQACKVLGVSVMTFHRWRKQEAARGHHANGTVTELAARTDDRDGIPPVRNRIDELRLENERLRRIVTDLLLEKMKIEEKLALRSSGGSGLSRRGEVQS